MYLQSIEQDFILGVLSEEELGNTLHIHDIQDGFACEVRNMQSYDALSQAILQRWSFPFVLDIGLLHEVHPEIQYAIKRHNCYRQVCMLLSMRFLRCANFMKLITC